MSDSNDVAKESTESSTGSDPKPPEVPLATDSQKEAINYKEVIRGLSKMLIKISWTDLLKKPSVSTNIKQTRNDNKETPVFTTVEQQIRDTIDNLENLAENSQEAAEYINDAITALNQALKALYSASILAEEADSQIRIKCFDFVEMCRTYLNNAADQLPETIKGS